MDFPIHSLKTSQGIPVFFEQFPDFYNPVSIRLCVYSGGADDMALNAPGIHHWGEHIPFRGTVGYPDGNKDIMSRVSELGGSLNAFTSHLQTVYYASVPKRAWYEGASIVTDLASRPLLRPEDIEAERTIIGQEIKQNGANVDRQNYYLLREALWAGHPYGVRVIGTRESLEATSLDSIQTMRAASYGRKRVVMFVAGALTPEQVVHDLSELLERMPDNDIEERRAPAFYGDLPQWQSGKRSETQTQFETTVVSMNFPTNVSGDTAIAFRCNGRLQSLFSVGSLASPLFRVLRHERHLVYSTSAMSIQTRYGGMLGLTAKTAKENVEKVLEAYKDVLRSPEIRSDERWEYVRTVGTAEYDMQLPDPFMSTNTMQGDYDAFGFVRSHAQSRADFLALEKDQVMMRLEELVPERAHTVILRGT